jgi:hypothetical protein
MWRFLFLAFRQDCKSCHLRNSSLTQQDIFPDLGGIALQMGTFSLLTHILIRENLYSTPALFMIMEQPRIQSSVSLYERSIDSLRASTDCSSALRSKRRSCAHAFGRAEASLFLLFPALRSECASSICNRRASESSVPIV